MREAKLKKDLSHQNFVKETDESDHGLMVTIENRKNLKDLFLIIGNYDVLSLQEQESSLEDLFLSINK